MWILILKKITLCYVIINTIQYTNICEYIPSQHQILFVEKLHWNSPDIGDNCFALVWNFQKNWRNFFFWFSQSIFNQMDFLQLIFIFRKSLLFIEKYGFSTNKLLFFVNTYCYWNEWIWYGERFIFIKSIVHIYMYICVIYLHTHICEKWEICLNHRGVFR